MGPNRNREGDAVYRSVTRIKTEREVKRFNERRMKKYREQIARQEEEANIRRQRHANTTVGKVLFQVALALLIGMFLFYPFILLLVPNESGPVAAPQQEDILVERPLATGDPKIWEFK